MDVARNPKLSGLPRAIPRRSRQLWYVPFSNDFILKSNHYFRSVKTFADYDKFLPSKGTKAGHIYDKQRDPREIRQKLDLVKGHLVWMPLEFLKDAQMAETGLQVNSWTESIYT